MMKLSTVADLADALLRKHGQNKEYPFLTLDRMRIIAACEVPVDDIDAAPFVLSKETRANRLRARERAYYRSTTTVSGTT